jgi:hypothetical protein
MKAAGDGPNLMAMRSWLGRVATEHVGGGSNKAFARHLKSKR